VGQDVILRRVGNPPADAGAVVARRRPLCGAAWYADGPITNRPQDDILSGMGPRPTERHEDRCAVGQRGTLTGRLPIGRRIPSCPTWFSTLPHVVFGLALLLLLTFARPVPAATRPRYGGTLRVEMRGALESADPPEVGSSGAFTVVRWESGRRATYSANDAAPGGRPFLDTVEIEMGRPAREQALALELGKTDLAEVAPGEFAREGTRVAEPAPGAVDHHNSATEGKLIGAMPRRNLQFPKRSIPPAAHRCRDPIMRGPKKF